VNKKRSQDISPQAHETFRAVEMINGHIRNELNGYIAKLQRVPSLFGSEVSKATDDFLKHGTNLELLLPPTAETLRALEKAASQKDFDLEKFMLPLINKQGEQNKPFFESLQHLYDEMKIATYRASGLTETTISAVTNGSRISIYSVFGLPIGGVETNPSKADSK
jgi:hypothetical protein